MATWPSMVPFRPMAMRDKWSRKLTGGEEEDEVGSFKNRKKIRSVCSLPPDTQIEKKSQFLQDRRAL